MPFVYKYQVDVNGDYVLNGGNRVVEESYEFATSGGFDWRRVASSTKKHPYVRSFQIKKFDNGDTWLLIINQKQLVGIYPSQDAAIQVLLGCFTRVSASDLGALGTMSYQLSQGYSFIDAAYNNLSLTRSGDDLVVTLSLINTLDPAIATPIVTWDDYSTPGSPDATTSLGAVTEPEGGTQVFTIVGGWTASAENNYIQAFLEDSGVGVVVNSNVLIKDELDPSGTLSVSITNLAKDGPPEATWDGQTYAGAAYATPQWTVEDWPEGVTPSYQYAWSYQIDSGPLVPVGNTGNTLDLALVPFGATIKCGAVATAFVNGKVVDSASPAPMVTVAVSGEIPVSFVTDPGADTADPQVPASVAITAFTAAGTAPITTTYVWKRGSATIAGATSSSYTTQPADVGSILTCIVTIDNAFGDPDSRTVSFGLVEAADVVLDVVDIKLFAGILGSGNTAQPAGQEVSFPVPNTEYYAFAYDGNGDLIQAPVTWTVSTAPGGWTVLDTYTRDLSDGSPTCVSSGKWSNFDGGTWASGSTAQGVDVKSSSQLTPTDSSAAIPTQGGLDGAALKLAKASGSLTLAADVQIRVTFFEPGTTNQRSAPITSTEKVLNSGNYYFKFAADAVTMDNADDNAAWGWQIGDKVVFELIEPIS